MVMVILGIMSAQLVPRYYNFAERAHKASIDTFIGHVKSSLYMYSGNEIIKNGYHSFPNGDDFENTSGDQFGILFDEAPKDWQIVNAGNDAVLFEYDQTTPATQVRYISAGDDSYVLEIIQGPDYVTSAR